MQDTIKLNINKAEAYGTIELTRSKSIANRALIIQALAKKNILLENLAIAKDTVTLQELLTQFKQAPDIKHKLDVGPAGTTMRFLTAYFACTPCEVEITGSERMLQRPIHVLVNALRSIGADITYTGKEGYPPLKINGKNLSGGHLKIDGSISSQFISALLLIAPTLEQGIELEFEGYITSRPYIEMTLRLMEHFGVKSSWSGNRIKIEKQNYEGKRLNIEADWSAASYWYSFLSFCNRGEILLKGLKENSLQGDSVLVSLYDELGIKSTFTKDGVKLFKRQNDVIEKEFIHDFTSCPDIAQTIAVSCAGLKINAHLTGLKTLKIKETDRIIALKNELEKFNILVKFDESSIQFSGKSFKPSPNARIKTYEDHRMAMAFAPLALIQKEIEIEHPEVVNKSYPSFWEDVKTIFPE